METIIGACGINCTQCKAHKATREYDVAAVERLAREWSKSYNHDVKPQDVWCTGCMTAGEKKCGYCAGGCEIRACVRSKDLSTCADCGDYACDKLQKFYASFPIESPAKVTLDALRKSAELMKKLEEGSPA